MDHNPPGSSVHGILQARVLEWAAISCSKTEYEVEKVPNIICFEASPVCISHSLSALALLTHCLIFLPVVIFF